MSGASGRQGICDYYGVTEAGVVNSPSVARPDPEDRAEAVAQLERAASSKPASFWAPYYLAAPLRESDRGRALDLYRRLANNRPDSALAWFVLGSALKEAGDIGGALDALKRFLEANRSHRDFLSLPTSAPIATNNVIQVQIKSLPARKK
jgi:tetratricopeptide (TPR) repeat protein